MRLTKEQAKAIGLLKDKLLKDKRWSNAVPTEVDGIRFASKMEARVYCALEAKYGKDAIRCQVRLPLLDGAPQANGRPLYMTVDFAVEVRGAWMFMDAKGTRKSREWARGKSLFEQTWGTLWEWDGKGEIPWEAVK